MARTVSLFTCLPSLHKLETFSQNLRKIVKSHRDRGPYIVQRFCGFEKLLMQSSESTLFGQYRILFNGIGIYYVPWFSLSSHTISDFCRETYLCYALLVPRNCRLRLFVFIFLGERDLNLSTTAAHD